MHQNKQLPKIKTMEDLILIVDDEEGIRNLIQGILEDEGYRTVTAKNDVSAYDIIETQSPDLIIQDIWLENSEDDGIKILETVKKQYAHIPVIMISGHGTIETAVNSIKIGAYDFIEKPFKSDRLLLMIERALENAKLIQENISLKAKVQKQSKPVHLIGESQNLITIKQALERVAPTNSRVLLTGEAGTGKDMLARYIHELSDRADQLYTAVNCAILTPDRLEIELFGSSSTISGEPPQQGVLERANGGTLLLDEIADMPIETQGKILRVLQEQRFQRVGDNKEISVDIRIIASSNKDLEAEIEKGTFRKDLYYRLNVVPMHLEPLRERIEDIEPLTTFFIEEYSEFAGLPAIKFSSATYSSLQAYDWPGNVRQLKNTVEWVMIMHKTNDQSLEIMPHHLPPDILQNDNQRAAAKPNRNFKSMPLKLARETFEKEYIEQQIERFEGNISKTASFIGMERSALHRKLKQLGVEEHKKDTDADQTLHTKAT